MGLRNFSSRQSKEKREIWLGFVLSEEKREEELDSENFFQGKEMEKGSKVMQVRREVRSPVR